MAFDVNFGKFLESLSEGPEIFDGDQYRYFVIADRDKCKLAMSVALSTSSAYLNKKQANPETGEIKKGKQKLSTRAIVLRFTLILPEEDYVVPNGYAPFKKDLIKKYTDQNNKTVYGMKLDRVFLNICRLSSSSIEFMLHANRQQAFEKMAEWVDSLIEKFGGQSRDIDLNLLIRAPFEKLVQDPFDVFEIPTLEWEASVNAKKKTPLADPKTTNKPSESPDEDEDEDEGNV